MWHFLSKFPDSKHCFKCWSGIQYMTVRKLFWDPICLFTNSSSMTEEMWIQMTEIGINTTYIRVWHFRGRYAFNSRIYVNSTFPLC
jgi:hypothetical protein